jgi:large subunit ribosomal protein L10
VALAKEITRLIKSDKFGKLEARGGIMDGQRLSSQQVAEVSKWPSRAEQLSIVLGQILSPGANLVSQLGSVGGALASQIEQRAEALDTETPGAEAAPAEAPSA